MTFYAERIVGSVKGVGYFPTEKWNISCNFDLFQSTSSSSKIVSIDGVPPTPAWFVYYTLTKIKLNEPGNSFHGVAQKMPCQISEAEMMSKLLVHWTRMPG